MLTYTVYERDTRVRRYAEYLAAEGHLVDIVCLASDTPGFQPAHRGVRLFPLSITRHRREGLRLVVSWALAVIAMFFRTTRLDLRFRYDLVHVHNMPDLLVFCALIPRLRGCPVILNIHDPTPELARSKLGLSEKHILVRIQVFAERICAAFSSHLITATPSFERLLVLRGIPAEKITVITNAADPRFFSHVEGFENKRSRQGEFILLYVGTVARRYGLQVCVEALSLLHREIRGIKLRVFPKIRDEGKGLDECIRLAQRIGVEHLVEVADPVPLEQMADVMRNSDLGVYPALRDCHMDIALSLKIHEMTSVGLPILATRLSVLEELYGDDCIAFVPPGDPEALAAKVLELYRKPELMRRLSDNALRRSGELTWDSQYAVYKALVESLAGSHGANDTR